MTRTAFFLFFTIFLFLQNYQLKAAATAGPAGSTSTAVNDDAKAREREEQALAAAISKKRVIRAVHLTSWAAGTGRTRRQIITKMKGTVLNAVVVALKEMNGEVYIAGVKSAEKYKSYAGAIPRPEEMVKDFKDAGFYTIGRIVVFKDDILPRKRPDLGVKTPEDKLWKSYKGEVWLNPYKKEVWDYTLEIASRAVAAGFDEIQFDYVRFPSDGHIKQCRYGEENSSEKAIATIGRFIRYARSRIPKNITVSADVFGLTTSHDDIGIGQDISVVAAAADMVCPMMYPSHYYPGSYNLKNPNSQPYKVINRGLKDAKERLGTDFAKMRPYLQDFSIGGIKYGPDQIIAQLKALHESGLKSWTMWNPANRYSYGTLTPQKYRQFVDPGFETRKSTAAVNPH